MEAWDSFISVKSNAWNIYLLQEKKRKKNQLSLQTNYYV